MRSRLTRTGPRRQWGGDRRKEPLSALPPVASDTRMAFARLAIVVTLLGWLAYFTSWLIFTFISPQDATTRSRVEAVVYLLIVTMLMASAVAYLVCRLGAMYRSNAHRRVPTAALDNFFSSGAPSLTVIVPSYREDERVIRQTLMSAALQEYADLRVVLLLDDPPNPSRRSHRHMLERARALPGLIEAELAEPHQHVVSALGAFLARDKNTQPTLTDMEQLALTYDTSVAWLEELADNTEIVDHSDRFFADHVVRSLAATLSVTAAALRAAAADGVVLPRERIVELYRRVDRTFDARLTSFERKQYVSLSHEANKAMNLNSYIGLMGNSYRDVETISGRVLLPASPDTCDLDVPNPDYVLTLDADSILLPEYCQRLVYLMEQEQHADVGVAQTPYSSYPGASTRLERIAGASTDLQHITHQGMTYYGATFWVGANAVLRKRALDEIVETSFQGNFEIHRYVQDHTVIEDTESTVDLRIHGWQLVNYPERLSYSATPPDFGSLSIQRRRWANGGLLIMPKLRRQRKVAAEQGKAVPISETMLRLNYMASICWASFSLLILLGYPFRNDLVSPLLGLIAVPYFAAMASDLKQCGYKRLDVLRIYGFNLVLLPVNLAGVFSSLVQAITGDRSVFGRTPKVSNRTVPPFSFVITPYLVVALAVFTMFRSYDNGYWNSFVYATINSVLAVYAIAAFIGLRYTLMDAWVHLKERLYKPVKPAKAAAPAAVVPAGERTSMDWASVLHFGGSTELAAPVTVADTKVRPGSTRSPAGYGASASGDLGLDFRTVFQPIVDLTSGRPVGYEALTRFDDGIAPDRRLAELASSGGNVELEMMLTRAAVEASWTVPSEAWVAINVSAQLAEAGTALQHALEGALHDVVLEIPAGQVRDSAALQQALANLPGVSLSLSGVEADYEVFTLIAELRPRFVKLQRSWLEGLATDPVRRALITALVAVAEEGGLSIIAEGIEESEDVATLRELGVPLGQGFLLGRPGRLPSATHVPVDTYAGITPRV